MTLIYETDWLASRPLFYNVSTGKVSGNINDVIDYANLEIHPEGFNNYLNFGYSILEQTPVKEVKFLRHSSRLIVHDDGRLEVEYLEDPVIQWMGKVSREDDVLHELQASIQKWEKSVEGDIIIPTSGGYDSRLLNFFIKDKSRIRSFTYGLSENQAESFEVVGARRISELLGTRWEQIELGDFHRYFDDWDKLFGASTHAHGMYHIEFYTKIMPKVEGNNPFLSGIFGDVWAGSVVPQRIQFPTDLHLLGYTHGMNADFNQSLLHSERSILENFLESNRFHINDPVFQTATLIRLKIILICYLLRVPEHFGFKPWSPFLDRSIALGMNTLPPERRNNRVWQREYFQKNSLDFDSIKSKASHQNTLNLQALNRIPLKPLEVGTLREVVKPAYIEWINKGISKNCSGWREEYIGKLLRVKKLGGALRRLGVEDATDRRIQSYLAYLVLLPVQNLLKRRNKA